jgi:hypothetical protein
VQPVDSPYNGFCNRGTLTCAGMDCREGTDPVTGVPYKDCRIPYACNQSDAGTGTNVCRLLTCVEQGGAIIACRQGQYCCGEDKDQDGKADPCPPPQMLQMDNCYDAPVPPFCTVCATCTFDPMSGNTCTSTNDFCGTITLPPYLTNSGACANGSQSPNCSPLPYVCAPVAFDPMFGTPTMGVCAVPTWNDGAAVPASHTTQVALGCPVNWQYQIYRPDVRPMGSMVNAYCETDSDCNQGTDAGRCAPDNTLPLPDGGHTKACLCTVGVPGTCPNDIDAGLTSECRYGISGQTVPCVQSIACLPNSNILFSDGGPPVYGCGLTPP